MIEFQITKSFTEGNFHIFEHELTDFYFRKWKSFLDLTSNYSDWLVHFFRLQNRFHYKSNSLKISYLDKFQTTTIPLKQLKQKYLWLQMLWFIQQKTNIQDEIILLNQKYFIVHFLIQNFVNFLQLDYRKNDIKYQLNQVRDTLQNFQINPQSRIEYFDLRHHQYRSALIFPVFEIKKTNNQWRVHLAVDQLFYQWNYPFYLNSSFQTYEDTYELRIKHFFMEHYCQHGSQQKVFPVMQFFTELKVSNKSITQIKDKFILLF